MAGVRASSWMRCGQGTISIDTVVHLSWDTEGLRIRTADTGQRGRDHLIIVPYALLDDMAEKRHGIAELKRHQQQLITLGRVITDIGKISRGAEYTLVDTTKTEEAA